MSMTYGVFISALLAACVTQWATSCSAPDGPNPAGAWVGRYTCAQGLTALDLTIEQPTPGRLRAQFHFSAVPSNPEVPEGCFLMTGRFDGRDHVVLEPSARVDRPAGFVMVGLDGTLTAGASVLTGNVTQVPVCTTFTLSRVIGLQTRAVGCHRPGEFVASAG
jgi:hypothetical protein